MQAQGEILGGRVILLLLISGWHFWAWTSLDPTLASGLLLSVLWLPVPTVCSTHFRLSLERLYSLCFLGECWNWDILSLTFLVFLFNCVLFRAFSCQYHRPSSTWVSLLTFVVRESESVVSKLPDLQGLLLSYLSSGLRYCWKGQGAVRNIASTTEVKEALEWRSSGTQLIMIFSLCCINLWESLSAWFYMIGICWLEGALSLNTTLLISDRSPFGTFASTQPPTPTPLTSIPSLICCACFHLLFGVHWLQK